MLQKIIIVDDDAAQLQLMRRLFQGSYQLIEVQNAKDVINTVKQNSPDLVILDYMMPDFNGLEVCKQIREMSNIKQPKIIMLTAHTRALDRVQSLLAGANDYVSKPFESRDLLARVKVLL